MILDNVAKLYQFRWLVYELVLRNVRLRYRGSLLGFLWTFLNPVLFVGIYTLVFSVFLKAGIHNFALFVLAGMVPYTCFSASVLQGTTSILDGRAYVGKTLFPTIVLTVVPVLTNAVNLALSLPLVVIVAILCHVHVGVNLLFLPVIFILQLLLTQALTTLFATINVFFRDLQELMAYAMSALFFLTPIIYDASRVPERFQPLLTLNPLTPIVEGYQAVLYSGTLPSLSKLGYVAGFTIVALLIANALFLRYREMFSEYV
jgi:lipopolysaccharide transport system permease protein